MATINHSSGADIIVPSNNGTTYRGLGGDDTYILSNSIAANAAITIVDTSGANKIQLVDGLSISSSNSSKSPHVQWESRLCPKLPQATPSYHKAPNFAPKPTQMVT